MRRFAACFIGIFILFFAVSCTVLASDREKILEVYTGEDTVSIYVKGLGGEIPDTKVTVGTAAGTVQKAQKLSETSVPVHTLVMVDNSVSIKPKQQDKIADLLQDIISDRMGGEKIALAVFGEELSFLTDFTEEYGALKQALEKLEYQDQETYLTDVLYEYLEDALGEEDIFLRIIVVSDGVDNKEIGYTKEELYSFLEKNPVPIDTVGCKGLDNGEQLESMFALSRITGGSSFVLDDVENLEIFSALTEDRDIVRYVIAPEASVLDGSRKVVTLDFGGSSVQAEVKMPQQAVVTETMESEPEPETETAIILEPESQKEEESSWNLALAGIVIGIFVAAAALMIVMILLIKKKGKEAPVDFEPFVPKQESWQKEQEDGKTVVLAEERYNLILEDVLNPARSFQASFSEGKPVVIGRKKERCHIGIDYEPSVSGVHCEIGVRGHSFYLKDLQSSNGTFLNKTRVTDEAKLIPGNVITLGKLSFKANIY